MEVTLSVQVEWVLNRLKATFAAAEAAAAAVFAFGGDGTMSVSGLGM